MVGLMRQCPRTPPLPPLLGAVQMFIGERLHRVFGTMAAIALLFPAAGHAQALGQVGVGQKALVTFSFASLPTSVAGAPNLFAVDASSFSFATHVRTTLYGGATELGSVLYDGSFPRADFLGASVIPRDPGSSTVVDLSALFVAGQVNTLEIIPTFNGTNGYMSATLSIGALVLSGGSVVAPATPRVTILGVRIVDVSAPAIVPEPSQALLMAAGLIGLVGVRTARRRTIAS